MAKTDQQRYRGRLKRAYKGCIISGLADPKFLVASHIKPKIKCDTNAERYDEANGFLLLPHFDYLFDKGFISFEDDGSIKIATDLPPEMAALYGIYPSLRISIKFSKTKEYLSYHREHIFEKRYKELFAE